MTPKVSVIIPVYNAQDYLSRCVDSLLNQTLRELELILVDDGSTDSSGMMCDTYAEKDRRFKCVHKTNGGVASARNVGLELATGEFVIHCDPEDWVEHDMYEKLYDAATKNLADVVICDSISEFEGRSVYHSLSVDCLDGAKIVKNLIAGDLNGAVWNKLINRELIKKYGVRFVDGLNVCEDLCFLCEILPKATKIVHLEQALYHYDLYSNNNSIVRGTQAKLVGHKIRLADYLQHRLDSQEYADSVYKLKYGAKISAFVYNTLRGRELNVLFEEINVRIINEPSKFMSVKFIFKLHLQGSIKIARLLMNLRSLFYH